MTRGTITRESQLLDEADQGLSDLGQPLVPSDPWTAGWAPPSESELERKHAMARKRERQLARTGHSDADGLDPPSAETETPRTTSSPATPRPLIPTERRSLRRILGVAATAATAYWYYALATLAIAIAIPLAAGWHSSTVITGSMEPLISPGDVVAVTDYDGSTLSVGTIIQFQDPSHPGQSVTHRIVGVNPDGTYVTKGDANRAADSTPVPPDSIIGVARLVAPNAGLPQLWLERHDHLLLAGWAVATVGALAIMSIHSSIERREQRVVPEREPRRSILRPAVAFGLVAAIAGVGTATWSQGRFAAVADTGSTFQSATSFAAFEHGGTLGTVACQTGQSTITLTGFVGVGDTVIVRFALRDVLGGAGYSASDTAGNVYTVDAVANDGTKSEVAILSAHVSSSLAVGDQITLTHPDGRAVSATFDVFGGVAATNRVVGVGVGSGNDQTPLITATTTDAPALTIGYIAVRDVVGVSSPVSGWTALPSGVVSCSRDFTDRAAYGQANSAGDVTYDPTFDSKNRWSGAIVAYRSG